MTSHITSILKDRYSILFHLGEAIPRKCECNACLVVSAHHFIPAPLFGPPGCKSPPTCTIPGTGSGGLHKARPGWQLLRVYANPTSLAPVSRHKPRWLPNWAGSLQFCLVLTNLGLSLCGSLLAHTSLVSSSAPLISCSRRIRTRSWRGNCPPEIPAHTLT